MHEAVKQIIKELNGALTENLIKNVSGKNVLLHLSGGHDTRVNLSILLKKNIQFTAYTARKQKRDIEISKRIAKKYKFEHIVDKREIKKFGEIKNEMESKYDVVITALRFTEILCFLHSINRSYEFTAKKLEIRKKNDNRYSPIIEKNTIDIAKRIPLIYLAGGTIQKELIRMNEKKLLNFPFTYYDYRHYIINTFYPPLSDFIFNS
jgi:hypothetical protein